MKPIVHTCQQGTYACDYAQDEAVKVKRAYVPPVVEVLLARIEKGYSLSGGPGMTEAIGDYGYHEIGNPEPMNNGDHMLEGIVNGGTYFF